MGANVLPSGSAKDDGNRSEEWMRSMRCDTGAGDILISCITLRKKVDSR